jgi:hypothetical protein
MLTWPPTVRVFVVVAPLNMHGSFDALAGGVRALEQPTIYFPVVIIAALIHGRSDVDLGLAWAYVALRAVHSVFQATVNTIEVRFVLFFVSSLVLFALVARTALALW